MVVLVLLNRLPSSSLPRDSRPWSRFSVHFINPVPVSFVGDQLDGAIEGGRFLQMKVAQEREHLAAGSIGTLTIVISATSVDGPVVHNVSCIGFGEHSKHALKIEDHWKETFEQTVEKLCGRMSGDEGVVATFATP